ncbi:MAG: hypothetical protein ACJAVY_000174 [Marinoscillum sp.]|jgi:hypothetical protein
MWKSLIGLFIISLLAQCSAPKNACLQLTNLDQKYEKLPKRLSKANSKDAKFDLSSLFEEDYNGLANQRIDHAALGGNEEGLPVYAVNDQGFASASLGNEKLTKRIEKLQLLMDEMRPLLALDTILTVDTSKNPVYIPNQFNEQHRKAKKNAGLSLAFVLLTFIPAIGILAYIASVVLAFRSLKLYKKSLDKKGRGLAIASLTIAGIFLAALLFLLFIVIVFFWGGSGW